MGEAMRATGLGPEFEFRGKFYPVSPWTPEMTGRFEAWLEQRAWDALERTRATTPPHLFGQREERLMRMIATGQLGFGSEAAGMAGQSLEGLKFSFFLQLKPLNPDVDMAFVESVWEERLADAMRVLERNNAPDPTTPPETTVPAAV